MKLTRFPKYIPKTEIVNNYAPVAWKMQVVGSITMFREVIQEDIEFFVIVYADICTLAIIQN